MVERKKYGQPGARKEIPILPNVRVSELQREGADGSVLRVRLDDGSLFVFSDDHPAG
jgi:hypothetical protein